MAIEPQAGIEEKFAASFEACDALDAFGLTHRPHGIVGGTRVLTWTLARSARTFRIVVYLCRLGYGQQASMLNRTLFEDMVSAHWAARFPARANRRMRWHEEWVKLRRIAVYKKHHIPSEMTPPDWDALRKKRMRRLFGKTMNWSGCTVPQMVTSIEGMWPEGEERDRLHRMHDVIHQAFNGMMHHSARSLSIGVKVAHDGGISFELGPSEDFVPLALGFAFWTYANTISLTVDGAAADELNELATRYEGVIPDHTLMEMIAKAASDSGAG